MSKRVKLSILAVPLVALCGVVAAADDKPSKVVVCAACHQENGVSQQGIYPNLAGQYENYLEHSLKAYRSGDRKNAIMSAQAANLSDADIRQLAKWYSTQKPAVYTPDPEARAQ